MRGIGEAWNGFWFARGPSVGLALFRIVFAGCLLGELPTSWAKSLNALDDGGFHLPYLDALPFFSEPAYALLHLLQLPLILLLGLGLLMRPACAGLLTIHGLLLFADRLNFRNHPWLVLLLLALLLFSPAAESLSLRAWLRARRGRASEALQPLTFQRLIQVQLCVVYLLAAVHKLHPAYLKGEVLHDQLLLELPRAAAVPPSLLAALACATVLLELTLPFGLWAARTRPLSIALGIVFHLTLAWIFGVAVFSCVMIAGYILFVDPARLRAVRLNR